MLISAVVLAIGLVLLTKGARVTDTHAALCAALHRPQHRISQARASSSSSSSRSRLLGSTAQRVQTNSTAQMQMGIIPCPHSSEEILIWTAGA